MSYKCAVFGHKYGEVDVHRERTEDGDEVIVTVRETEACKRCGDTRIISENKEVRTMETAADIVADDLDEESDNEQTAADDATDDVTEPTPTEAVQQVAEGPATVEESTDTAADAVDPEEDDGVILDDDDDEPTREEGEWPVEAERKAKEESTQSQKESRPGWPDHHDEDDDDAEELPSDIDPHPGAEQPSGRGNGTVTVPEGQFYCSNCEFTTPVESSSLRAGDFCPECHKGALERSTE